MAAKVRKAASLDTGNNGKKVTEYVISESPLDFYVSEQTVSYCRRVLKGDGGRYMRGQKNG